MRPMIELTTSSVNKHQLSSVDYLHLPYLPFDLVEQILCRLPVNTLLRIRCVCKSFNSLISDPKFAKKHLSMSTRRRLHIFSRPEPLRKYTFTSCPLHYVFTTVPTNVPGFYPSNNHDYTQHTIVGSCNGILCLVREYAHMSFLLFWNPSIRKVKELSPLCYPDSFHTTYGFGYDIVNDNYKVVAVFSYNVPDSSGDLVDKTEVKINILGTNFWKNLPDSPFNCMLSHEPGRFVSGNINWLASKHFHHSPCFIVSLDLRKESYQKLLLPDCGELDVSILILSVLKDCLCMTYGHDVWIMKEYGNNESWTKLFTVPYMRYCRKSYHLRKTIYMFEDGRVLLEVESNRVESNRDSFLKLIVYDPRIGTFKFVKFQNKSFYNPIFSNIPEICIESLISTCF